MDTMRNDLRMIASDARARLGAFALLAWVGLMVVGLGVAFQEPLFFGLGPRSGQGIDFFCVPKAFLNLLAGESAFDTWGGERYGPYATWFVLHPAVALWIGAYLAWLPAWWAYAAWVAASLLGLGTCGLLLAGHVSTPARKVLVFSALLASPITYALLFCGNVHGVIALAVALLLVGLHELASGAPIVAGIPPVLKVALGLLLSLLCKPVLILVAPALLLTRATRSATLGSLAAYAVISLAFLLVPALNPEAVGPGRLLFLLLHPEWVKAQLEVYAQRFVLIPEMLDNAMHWFHMVAQSDNAWDHVQVFSLPVTVRAFMPVPTGMFRWLALLPVVASPLLLRLPEARRPIATEWLVVLALASHFLGYAIAWEYQYSQLLVVAAALLSLSTMRETSPRWLRVALAGLALLYVPTPYLLLKGDGLSPGELLWMRAFRVGPALLTAVAALGAFAQLQRVATPHAARREGVSVAPFPRLPVLGAATASVFAAVLLAPVAVLAATRLFANEEANASRLDHQINRSRALLDAQQARASLVPLERARRLDPDAFAVQNNLCVAYGMLERREEAMESCRRALAIQPDSGLARNNLAWVETIRR
jgi:tetratricopeptide (TPR) repeat protein